MCSLLVIKERKGRREGGGKEGRKEERKEGVNSEVQLNLPPCCG
jgi:hypothetical protein